jgi:hypothetical protein
MIDHRGMLLRAVACVDDIGVAARECVDADTWDCLMGGAGDKATLASNLDAFRRVFLRPTVVDITRDLAWQRADGGLP